ncbi:MAG: stage II sporulation protein P [Ruminiclostridium sp.]|nr:stage II sporulation protein P [Ruminiclostridium sp.]
MIVIRTSVKRKMIRAAVPAVITAVGFSSVLFGTQANDRMTVVLPTDSKRTTFTSIENMNAEEPTLFTTGVTELPVETEPLFTEETFASESPEQKITDNNEEFSGKYLLTQNLCLESENMDIYTSHSGAIYEETLGRSGGPEYIDLANGAQLRNCTDIDNETILREYEKDCDINIERFSDEPQVLILHTHTTESYEPYTKDWYDEQYTSRSYDADYSVVAVGNAVSGQLASAGISVIHDCTVHDAKYSGAYTRSLETAQSLIEQYPSIKIVLDIHRDAIEYSDGSRVSTVAEIDGKKAAQVMIICAADDGTYGVPDFFDNMRFACRLQESMEGLFPTLTRPILFQYCQYNQQVSHGALLMEVGSHGNSIDEAVYSGELIGRSLASMLTGGESELENTAVPVLASVPAYFFERLR